MKHIFSIGDKKQISCIVSENDLAAFQGNLVHPFYSTFALGRDAEWCCRQFVLEMKDEDEEGIGTFLQIHHQSPAMIGSKIDIIAEIEELKGNSITCKYTVYHENRIIAKGSQGQKILKKSKVDELKLIYGKEN